MANLCTKCYSVSRGRKEKVRVAQLCEGVRKGMTQKVEN